MAAHEHITDERLLATDPTEAEQAHLRSCPRCRVQQVRLREWAADGASRTWDEDAPDASASDATQDHPTGARIGGKYVVEAVLGRGAFGTVYAVRHVQLGSTHALKVLRHADPRVAERFKREGRLQATLEHPNVVRVTDIITVDSALGLVMEYVRGPDLRQVIHEKQLGTWAEREQLAAGILRGVHAAHQAGWVHRDLKPANILLAPAPPDAGTGGARWTPKITDFGLARVMEEEVASVTCAGEILGTAAYMSPEQFKDPRSVDHRTDVFALGAILYEIATGRRAFAGATITEIQAQIESGRYVAPREIVPDVSPGLEAAIRGALFVDRVQRLPDCDAMLRALQPGTGRRPARRVAAVVALASALLGAAALALVLLVLPSEGAPPPPPPPGGQTVVEVPTTTREQPVVEVPTATREQPVIPAQPEPPPPAATYVVTIESDPPGARVFQGTKDLGKTPFQARLAAGEAARWTLKLDGYLDQPVKVTDVRENRTEKRTLLRTR